MRRVLGMVRRIAGRHISLEQAPWTINDVAELLNSFQQNEITSWNLWSEGEETQAQRLHAINNQTRLYLVDAITELLTHNVDMTVKVAETLLDYSVRDIPSYLLKEQWQW